MRVAVLALAALAAAGCMGPWQSTGETRKASGKTSLAINLSPGDYLLVVNCQNPGQKPLPLYSAEDITSPRTCARLHRLGAEAFAPVPKDVACTQIYGGPRKAHVDGLVDGRPVKSDFNRENGCEIARWKRLSFLFPDRG